GMDAKIVDELRAAVHKANAALDHDTQYITQECSMLDADEATAVLEPRRNRFAVLLADIGLVASNWTQQRVQSPGGLVPGKA
ncbi:MAG: hypothetical protein GX086_13795, partial [Alcaligenaceae bacterium]|nr:hypothetical protein [Alcaligenaceae bacterium]